MGAVTALLYSQKDPSIAGVVSRVDIHTLHLPCVSNAYDVISKIANTYQQQELQCYMELSSCL